MKSYNRVDTTVSTKGGRVVVDSNMKRRMQKVLNALTSLTTTSRHQIALAEVVQRVKKWDTTHSYSYTDILYALRRLMSAGLVYTPGWGFYQLTIDPSIAKTTIR
jgi:uncharacterized protein Veg